MAKDHVPAPPKPAKRLPPPRHVAGPGRPKGIPNKMTIAARDTIMQAAEEIGGWKRLATWALDPPANETLFWSTIYPRLLPLEVRNSGTPMQQIGVQIVSYLDPPLRTINGHADEMDSPAQPVGGKAVPEE